MNLKEYLGQWSKMKVLIKGPTGCGKTVLATMATQVWKTLYIDVEGGAMSGRKCIKEENIDIKPIREPDTKVFFEKLADHIAEAESGKYECVVVDSLSFIGGRMEDEYASKSDTGKLEFGDWSGLLSRIKRLCHRLHNMDCHTIVTSLTKPTGKEDSSAIFEPAFSGQSAAFVPSMFDTVGLVRRVTIKSKSSYSFTTDGPSIFQVRDRTRILAPDEDIDESNPGEIWRKLSNGISNMSMGKEGKKK